MGALKASYGDASSDSDSDVEPATMAATQPANILPPPPISLLQPPNSLGAFDYLQTGQANRVRSFLHVDGNFALHVYCPVHIPSAPRKELTQFLRRVSALLPGLNVLDIDIPLSKLDKDDKKFEQVLLGREFHVSSGGLFQSECTRGILLYQCFGRNFCSRRGGDSYLIDFDKWTVFVNDDRTRTFLSIEVTAGGLAEISKQIKAVDEDYRLHNLPEFYKDPRPHISIAWASGDVSDLFSKALGEAKSFTTVGSSTSKKSLHQ